ncbi:MAG: hypothetical protein KC468_07610, partial [Myxococcales bacterium]|nr:hypothetical protein [Myxococcales bacterium]
RIASAGDALRRLEGWPGSSSRVARHALASLCQEHAGVSRPRTAVPPAPMSTYSLSMPSLEVTGPRPEGTVTRTRVHGRERLGRGGLVALAASGLAVVLLVLIGLELTRSSPRRAEPIADASTPGDAELLARSGAASERDAAADGAGTVAEDALQAVPGSAPDTELEDVSNDVPEDASEDVPEDAPEDVLEDASGSSDVPPAEAVPGEEGEGPATAEASSGATSAGGTRETAGATAGPSPQRSRTRRRAQPKLRSCGDNVCEPQLDENCRSCPADCGCHSNERCQDRRDGLEIACVPKHLPKRLP